MYTNAAPWWWCDCAREHLRREFLISTFWCNKLVRSKFISCGKFFIICFSTLLLIAAPVVVNAADVDHSYHLLRAKYRQLTADGNMGANFLLARGEAFAKKREYRAAAAAYLGSASETLRHEKFERAQPALSAAFALAPKLTSDERKDFLSVLREATSDLRSSVEREWVHKRALAIALTINDDGNWNEAPK
jgi:hypothetical protein